MKWISLRIIEAKTYQEALEKAKMDAFDETHELCDSIVLLTDILQKSLIVETPKKLTLIVFMQGEKADEPLGILNEKGQDAAIKYLAQWDQGEYYNLTDFLNAGSNDTIYEDENYILVYNNTLNYIGLSKLITET